MRLNEKINLNIKKIDKEIIIFGYGEMCKNFIREIRKDFNIKYIIDNDKSKVNKIVEGIRIVPYEEYLKDTSSTKVLISTHYYEIKEQLIASGKKEYEDFMNIYEFIPRWNLIHKEQVHIFKAEIMITTRCTLNCKKCGMFIPYYKSHKDRNIDDIKEDLDCFFSIIDRVYIFNILGGEPFLHKNFCEIIDYIQKKYSNKIGMITITTNGTVLPDNNILEKIKKYQIYINISDYLLNRDYSKRVDAFERRLVEFSIRYSRNNEIWWYDLGFPSKEVTVLNNTTKHMKSCALVCRGISEKKFYYCHLAWSAVNCGLKNDNPDDYIDLSNLDSKNKRDKEKIVLYESGQLKNGCLSLCKECAGMGNMNKNKIKCGIQLTSKE